MDSKLQKGELAHSVLLVGPSGCGKTTIARILRTRLDCSDSDFQEINCADFRGIETVREIRQRTSLAPIKGKCRVWLLDEVQQCTKDMQSGLLKILEDTPKHVYFLLCTTDPGKLLRTILTRCMRVQCKSLTNTDLIKLMKSVGKKEKMCVPDEILHKIAEASDGSARQALVILDQVSVCGGDEEAIHTIEQYRVGREGIELCRLLVNMKSRWGDCVTLLKELKEDPENLRRSVLGYASSCMLNNPNVKKVGVFNHVLIAFESNFFDSGRAGLVRACYEVFQSRSE